MEKRFTVLDILCKVQIVIGILMIAATFIFVAAMILMGSDLNPSPELPMGIGLIIALALGGIFAGLSTIAMAQVYQCLMQVEINTRPRVDPQLQSQSADLPAPSQLIAREATS
jgi:hypothetical protein